MKDQIIVELNQAQFSVLLLCLNQIQHDLETEKPHYTEAQLKVLPAVTHLTEHVKETAFKLANVTHKHLELMDHAANVLLEKEHELESDLLSSDSELLEVYEERDPVKLREALVTNLEVTEQANLLIQNFKKVFATTINRGQNNA